MGANYGEELFDENIERGDKKINNASNLKVSTIHQTPVEENAVFSLPPPPHKKSKTAKDQTNHTLPDDWRNNLSVQSLQNDI